MGQLSRPVLNVYLERKGNKFFKIGAASMQGYRSKMEDAHVIALGLPTKPTLNAFGVFDGHGGSQAAIYCQKHFVDHIDEIKSLSPDEVEAAVLKLDDKFLNEYKADSGCTATFALVNAESSGSMTVAIGNVGDSRSLLIRANGEFSFVTKDHKPDDKPEKKRILRANGSVFRHRVGGSLALSRAIGDKDFKENDALPQEEQMVTAVPDVSLFTAQPGDMLIMCCDGLFECLSNEELVKYILSGLKKSDDIALVLRELLMTCVEESADNMTAMIVQFTNGENYNKHGEFIPGPYFEGAEDFAAAWAENIAKYGLTKDQVLPKTQHISA